MHRFDSAAARLWVLSQMALARLSFRAMPDCGFWKLCGSGTGEGFTPRPNTAVWAILAAWPDAATAERRLDTAPVFRRWRAKASEAYTLFLAPTAARGAWSAQAPFRPTGTITGTTTGPVAALTRATIRPRFLRDFWRHEPKISAAIGSDPNVAFKIGIGELPWLHQVTFSVWPDTASMAHFARADGPHARAIRAVREGGWFAEELYARFRVTGTRGTWGGSDPLAKLERLAA